MATETVEEWVAIVWPEVKQLCHSVNPTEVLEELAALGWKRASESGDPELPDPFEELRTLVTKDLPAKSSCKLNTFRKALGDLRTKFVSDSTSPAHRGSYRTGSNDDVESDSYSFQGPVSETKTDLSADFRYIQLSQELPQGPPPPPVPLGHKLRRIGGSKTSKEAATVLVAKGDSALTKPTGKQQALRMYLRALRLHPADMRLYRKAFRHCMEVEDYANAEAVCNFWIWDFPSESRSTAEAYTRKVEALTANSQGYAVLEVLEEGYIVTCKLKFLSQCFVKASELQGGTQKLHFNPKPEDVKAVVQKFAAEGKFGIIAMLFLGGTSTIPKGSGGFATACRCKFPEFPLAEFIATQSPAQYSRSDLLKQLLRCGASPDGPSHRDNPSWNAWKTEQDDLLAILIKNGASLSGLMTNLFSHISPDNMLHGAVKNAILTGEINELKRVLRLAKMSEPGQLTDWECDKTGETVYTMACAEKHRKDSVRTVLEFLAVNEPDLNPEKTNTSGISPLQLAAWDRDLQRVIQRAIKNYRRANPWELEWRQPVIEKMPGLSLSDRDRKGLVAVLQLLRKGRLPTNVKKTVCKNGIHIRAAEVTVGEKKALLLWEEVIQCHASRNHSGLLLCPEKRRIWDLALLEEAESLKSVVEQISNSIESGENCNPKFKRKVKLYKDPNRTDAYEGSDVSHLGPKLYSVVDETATSKRQDIIEVCLPRSVREDDFTAEKFYAFSADVENRIREGAECYANWFPFIVTDEEQSVIQAQWNQQPILVEGRSGTGKTTCLVYRLWKSYQNHRQNDRLPRQIFVSKNPVFVKKVEKYFNKLCRGSGVIRTDSKQVLTPKQINSSGYPLFVTAREYFAMLDAVTRDDGETKRAREARSRPSKERQSYDEEKGITVEDMPGEAYPELNWHQDEIWDAKIDTPQLDEVETDAETDTGTWALAGEVTYLTFAGEMWKQLVKDGPHSKTLRPELVWKEIKSFIKGTWKALISKEGYLTEDQYLGLGKKQAPDYAGEQRKQIYDLSRRYKEILQGNRYGKGSRDECDRVRDLFLKLRPKVLNRDFRDAAEEVYIDEVQDFTEAEIAVVALSCSKQGNIFLTGDTAQAVTKGISFRFEDIQQLFRDMGIHARYETNKVHQLTENYRSHAGILDLAASIIALLKRHFSYYFDHNLPKDEGRFEGPKPVFLESCSTDTMAKAVIPISGKKTHVEFGAYQAIIVRSGDKRANLPEKLKLACICLTLFEAKGLEFQDVLLYNFFKDSEATDKDWKLLKILEDTHGASMGRLSKLEQQGANRRLLCSELKKFYTAVTRARRKIWVYDDETSNREPIATYFRHRNLIEEIKNPSSILEIVSEKFSKPSHPSEWKKWGKELEEERLWDCAAECYEFAGDSCSDKVKFCNAHSTVDRWLRNRRRVKLEDVVEAGDTFLAMNEIELAARAYYFSGNVLKAAKVLDLDDKGEAAIKLYKKARDQSNRDSKVTDALLQCCKKYHNWEVLVTVLVQDKRFYEAITEVNKYYDSIAADYPYSKPPTVTADQLLYEATQWYIKADSNQSRDRFVEIVRMMSDPLVERLIRDLQQSKNFGALKLVMKAGKLIPIDTAKMCYRSGNLKDAVCFSEGFTEQRNRTFWAHCKSLHLWQERVSRTNDAVVSDLQTLADECHQQKLLDGEIDAKYRLFRLNLSETYRYLSESYRLSVQNGNVFGQALSLRRIVSSTSSVLVISVTEVLRTVKIMCDFCKSLIQPCSAGYSDIAKAVNPLEQELHFLGVHIDALEDLTLWFPTKNEDIFLWELLGSQQLIKLQCKRDGIVEPKRLLSLVGQALIIIACDVMIGIHESTSSKTVGDRSSRGIDPENCTETADSNEENLDSDTPAEEIDSIEDKTDNELRVEGIEKEVDRLVDRICCSAFMVGVDCQHDWHGGLSEKENAAAMVADFTTTLNRLIVTANDWSSTYLKYPLIWSRQKDLVKSRQRSVKKVVELCFPGFNCKLPLSENSAMIGWGRRMDAETKSLLRYCAVEQWMESSCCVDLFNIWKIHQIAGDTTQKQLEDCLLREQQKFFKGGSRSQKPSDWLQTELSKSLVDFRDPTGESRLCLVVWLWIEFVHDVYFAKDFTSAFQALFYLVSFEFQAVVSSASYQEQIWDNTLMLIEIGVALALLILSQSGRAVAIPSPFVAGYLVLDAALSKHKKHRLRMEDVVKRCHWKRDTDIVWSWRFLSLAAAGIMQHDKLETTAVCDKSSASSHPQSTRVRQLVIVLTLLCNSANRSALRRRCVSILSGDMKQLLLHKAPASTNLSGGILTAREAMNCLREVLESYRPQQWIYRVDWNPELKYPLRDLRHGGEFRRYRELLEMQAIHEIPVTIPEDLPIAAAELKKISFPYICSRKLSQFWEMHTMIPNESEEEERVSSTSMSEVDIPAASPAQSFAPVSLLLRKSADDRNALESSAQSIEQPAVANVETSESRTDEIREPLEGGTAKESLVDSGETDRELSYAIDGCEAHFSKWLQIGPCLITSSGGEITSPRTDNHVLFPPDAVDGKQTAEISYSQYCSNSMWQGDRCLLDIIQLLPHDAIFSKHVDLYMKHHLMLDDSTEILVMRSIVKEGNQRSWNTIATLNYTDLESTLPVKADEDTWVRLENSFVTISSKHFCETCLVVKGKLQLAVLPYQIVAKPTMNLNEYHLHIYLSCCSKKRMESVSQCFPSDCTAVFKGVQIVTAKTSERAPLIITKHFLSEGWTTLGRPFEVITVEYEDLENHAQNEHPPQKWDLIFTKTDPTDPTACDSTQFRLLLNFSSKKESKDVWIRGSESTETGPVSPTASRPDDLQREIDMEDIRKMYLDVSHRWKIIARRLPDHSGLLSGVKDCDIDYINNTYEDNNERCHAMLHKWKREVGTKATVLEMVRVLCNSHIDLAEVATKVFGEEIVRRCRES